MGIFGSVHPIALGPRAGIVVATELGEFAAETTAILSTLGSESSAQPNFYAGELLRPLSESDEQNRLNYQIWCSEHWLDIEGAFSELTDQVSMIDCERTLCGQHLIIWFLGVGTAELGPLSVRLAERWQLSSVRFVSPENVRSLAEKKEPPFSASTAYCTWPEVQRERENSEKRFSKDAACLLQEHGIYQQKFRASFAAHPHHGPNTTTAMVRIRKQGAFWTRVQIANLVECSQRYGDGWLRPTTRQGWQIYGIAKSNLPILIKELDHLLLTTQGTCGNYPRNITCCPLALHGDVTERYASSLATELERLLIPKCPSYESIWLNDTPADSLPEIERTILPHKFKVGITTNTHVCNEVLSNDIAIIIGRSGKDTSTLIADIYLGGGLAFRLDRPETYPQLARYACTILADDILAFAHGLVQAFQKHAPRRQRRMSRLKYWLDAIGLEQMLLRTLQESSRPIKLQPETVGHLPLIEADHHGIHTYHGSTYVGLRWRAWGIHCEDFDLVHYLKSDEVPWMKHWYLTTHQEIVFGPLNPDDIDSFYIALARSGLSKYCSVWTAIDHAKPSASARQTLPQVTSCASLPTCSLALSDAEGHKEELAEWLAEFQSVSGIDLSQRSCRISGCSNNCSRPLLANIGLIAHGPNRYGVYLGGSHARQQLAQYTGREFQWGMELKEYLRQLCTYES
jgi:sulfite reductase beta subunit-like hemoprotein